MSINLSSLSAQLKSWARELGFHDIAITDTQIDQANAKLDEWLAKQYHGTMGYMSRNRDKRADPDAMLPGTLRCIVCRMDYLPAEPKFEALDQPNTAYISRYAQNKDYHKFIRKRLKRLAERMSEALPTDTDHTYRVFTDSAPVMEKPLAQKAGLGWQGKHTTLIHSKSGSWFFLGVIYTNLPLPIDPPQPTDHCGSCTRCIDICPTQAIVAPYQLDARRCISYLTIENKGAIPVEFRKAMGNRVYGCDDCQIVCPWNKFARPTQEIAFETERELDTPSLLSLFAWDEPTFLKKTEGSAIRRIGYEAWIRNLAVALGNAPYATEIVAALQAKRPSMSDMVAEHIDWALTQQQQKVAT